MNRTVERRGRDKETKEKENSHLRIKPPSKTYGFPTDILNFRRMIGNPYSKVRNQYQDFAQFQEDYHDAIQDFHWVQVLKSRKIGSTDTGITSFALNTFDRYAGHDEMLVAGNELRVAKEILLRFYEFFEDRQHEDGVYAFRQIEPELLEAGYTWQEAQKKGTKWYYDDLIKSVRLSQDPIIEFKNGTRFFAFAASKQEKSQSFRGTDDVIAILLSEAAHTGMKNDQPIMNALEPNLAQRDDADFLLESTGNGRRGFYFKKWQQAMDILSKEFNIRADKHQEIVDCLHKMWRGGKKLPEILDWFPLMWDYKVGIAEGIISQKYIEKEMRNPEMDFQQEFCCFDKETEVLTDQGFKLFKDLDQTEKIASLNTETLYLEYVKPVGYLKQKSKELISFRNEWCNLKVTPNHQMLIHKEGGYHKDKKYPQRFGFRDADKCKKHDQFYRVARWKGKSSEFIEIEGISIPTITYCKMMGYYLSEGNTLNITYENRNCWRTNITQHKDNNRILMFEDMLKLPFKVKLNKTVITFREKKICQYLKQFGYSYQKYIPQEIKDLSPEYIRVFLDAFLLGDGTLHSQIIDDNVFGKKKFNTQKIHYTSSKKLVDDLSECILKVGKVPSAHISRKKGSIAFGKYYSNHDAYAIHEGTRKHAKLVTMDIIKEDYNDYVYCVELPKNNTLYVRREGQCVWSGNCKFTSTYTSAIPVESLTFLDSTAKDYVEPIDLNDLTEDMVEPDYDKDYDKDADMTRYE